MQSVIAPSHSCFAQIYQKFWAGDRIQRSHLGQCKVQYVAISRKGGGLETVKTRVSGLNACTSKKRWKGGYERRYSKYRKLGKDK